MIQVLDYNYGNGKVSRKKILKAMEELWARKRAEQAKTVAHKGARKQSAKVTVELGK